MSSGVHTPEKEKEEFTGLGFGNIVETSADSLFTSSLEGPEALVVFEKTSTPSLSKMIL